MKLEEKVDRLPDEIITRLDDRYVKKDEIEKRFITRAEMFVIKWTLGALVFLLSIYTVAYDYFNK